MMVSLHPTLRHRSSIASTIRRDGQSHCLKSLTIIVCILVTGSLARSQSGNEKRLHSRAQLLNTEAPVSYPEQLVVTASGKTYLLDTDLSTLFTVERDSSL